MARDDHLDVDDLDTTPESDKVTMALIYLSTIFFLGAFILLQMKMGEYGIGLMK